MLSKLLMLGQLVLGSAQWVQQHRSYVWRGATRLGGQHTPSPSLPREVSRGRWRRQRWRATRVGGQHTSSPSLRREVFRSRWRRQRRRATRVGG